MLDAAGVTDKFKKNSNCSEGASSCMAYGHTRSIGGSSDVNIEKVFDQSNSEPFGQTNIMEWLGCSKSKATNVMNAMKKAEIVVQVKGFGVGKYKFTD